MRSHNTLTKYATQTLYIPLGIKDKRPLLKYASHTMSISNSDLLMLKEAGFLSAIAKTVGSSVGRKALGSIPWLGTKVGGVKATSTFGKGVQRYLGNTAMLSGFGAIGEDTKNPKRNFLSRFGHNMMNWKYHAAGAAVGLAEKPIMDAMGRGGLRLSGIKGVGKIKSGLRGIGRYTAHTSGNASGAMKNAYALHGAKPSEWQLLTGKGLPKGVGADEIARTAKSMLKTPRGAGKKYGKMAFDDTTRAMRSELKTLTKGTAPYEKQVKKMWKHKRTGSAKLDSSQLLTDKNYMRDFAKSQGLKEAPGATSPIFTKTGPVNIKSTPLSVKPPASKTLSVPNSTLAQQTAKTPMQDFSKMKILPNKPLPTKTPGFNINEITRGGEAGAIAGFAAPVGTFSVVTPILAGAVAAVPGVGQYAAKPLNTFGSIWEPEEFIHNLKDMGRLSPTGTQAMTLDGEPTWKHQVKRNVNPKHFPYRYMRHNGRF